jgi:hypothetical protein
MWILIRDSEFLFDAVSGMKKFGSGIRVKHSRIRNTAFSALCLTCCSPVDEDFSGDTEKENKSLLSLALTAKDINNIRYRVYLCSKPARLSYCLIGMLARKY